MGKVMRTDIVVGGKADSSFYQLGSEIIGLGNDISRLGNFLNGVSTQLIRFGTAGAKSYTAFEDYMLETEVAMRTQYESASELERAMDTLNDAALTWANNSRFTTEDVAAGISNAAHAGWDLQQILNGVPAAMDVALAGGMNLSEGLEYLIDISNAAGLGFEDMGNLVDYWAYAANRSSTTIPEMGQAMQKMGATLQFVKGDMAGLTTMLAVLANNGTKGTEAGTLLRNSMIRLIAPTKAAAEAMDGLNIDGNDLDEIYAGAAEIEKASKLLDAAGFSAYDSSGKLKNFLTIWQELDAATAGMTEKDRNAVLSAVFPTRTITGALALLEAASNGWDGLYDSILKNGPGYADYASEVMESGLGGTLRHLESTWDVLKTKTGGALADDVGSVAGALSGLIETVNGMDDGLFNALVGGLEALAVAGPALTVAGGAIKTIGAIMTMGTVGKIGLAAVALGMFAKAAHEMEEVRFAENFGAMSVDGDAIVSYLDSVNSASAGAWESISQYNDAVQEAFDNYESASSKLSESLLTSFLTKATLTEQDKQTLYGYGEQMRQALLTGIEGSYSASEEFVGIIAGNRGPAELATEDSVWGSIIRTLNDGYVDAKARAEELSGQLREAMMAAFMDGMLDESELDNIRGIYEQINEEVALQLHAQQAGESAAEREMLLRKAQSLGLDGWEQIVSTTDDYAANQLDDYLQEYQRAYAKIAEEYQYKIDHAQTQAERNALIVERREKLAYLGEGDTDNPYDGYNGLAWQAKADKAAFLLDTNNQLLKGSDLRDVWAAAQQYADAVMEAGAVTADALYGFADHDFSSRQESDILKQTGNLISALGGVENSKELINYYETTGNTARANDIRQALLIADLLGGGYAGSQPDYLLHAGYDVESARAQLDALQRQNAGTDELMQAMQGGDFKAFWNQVGNAFNQTFANGWGNIVENLRGTYDLSAIDVPAEMEGIHDNYAAWRLMMDETLNAEDYRIRVTPEVDKDALDALGEAPVYVDILPRSDGMGLSDLEDQGVDVNVDGDTTELQATIEAEDGKNLIEYIDGDAENLQLSILAEDGKTLIENVTGDITELAAAIERYNGKIITVNVKYKSLGGAKLYANGGRATEASIFGEAGPEWAIPEQHTARTAELLTAAAKASGFTWPELFAKTESTSNRGTTTLVYSPTIIAQDATGVEEKLRDDKKRLEDYLRRKRLLEETEVYA